MKRIAVLLAAAACAVSACGWYGTWAKRREARALERSIEERKGRLAAMSPEALERAEAESRERAIAQYEKILREYADVGREEMDEALYLLARLLFDREQQEFQRRQREFESARAAAQAAGGPPPEEPRPRYPGSKAVYERLLREFPDSSLREDALYDYAYILSEEGNSREAVYVFDTLVRERPRSRYAPEVHFRLGEYFFEALDLASAERHYREVLRFGQTDLTEKALFKLAWVYYNANRFDEAKTVLADLLDREAARVQREGREFAPTPILFFPGPRRPTIRDLEKKGTELYQETLEIVARVFAESGGVEDCLRFVRSRQTGATPPPYAAPLLHRLALVQKERAEFEAAARTYQRLLETDPTFRDAPKIEREYADVLVETKDLEAAARVRAGMLDKYDGGTPWARANPEEEVRQAALASARKALAWAIRYHHARGLERQQRSGGVPEDLRRAISLYEKYLHRFPDGKPSYDKRFRYAQALFAAGEHRRAAEVFRQVAFDEHFSHRREEAAFARVLSVEEAVQHGPRPLPKPFLAEVVAAYEDYIRLNPHSEKAPPLLYKEGQLYLEAGEFDRAAEVFERLVRDYAAHPLAAEARVSIAHSEFERGRYAEAEAAARLALDAAAAGGPLAERRSEIEDLYALAIFRQGERAAEAKRPLEAREQFRRLVDALPRSRVASRALYNAAAATEEAGQRDEAASLYERLLSDYPESDFASDAAVRLARFYEGRPEGGAALVGIFERVADFHPDHPNAEEFLFRAAQLAAKEKRTFEAQRLFEKYLARYRAPQASGPRLERLRSALLELGSSYAEAGATPLARLTLEEFLALPAGKDPAREEDRLARARAQLLLARMRDEEYRAVRIEPPLEQTFRRKERLLAEVVERYASPVSSGLSPVATEASFRIGAAYEEFASALEQAPRPAGLSDEERAEYDRLLQQRIRPFLAKAVEAYRVAVRAAHETGVSDEWTERSRERLAAVAPRAFARPPRPGYLELPAESPPLPALLRTFAGAPLGGDSPGFLSTLAADAEARRRRAFARGLEAASATPPDWATAYDRFAEAAADGPPEAGYDAAVAALARGETAEALRWLEEVGRRFPDFHPATFLAATLYERTGQRDRAAANYRRAAQAPEASAEERVRWGRFLEAENRTAEALAAYELARAADPAHGPANLALLRLRGNPSPSELEALLAPLSGSPRALVELGILAARSGALETAGRAFEAAEAILPPADGQARAAVLNNRALVALAQGDTAAAESFLRAALAADGSLGSLANTAGILRMIRGDFQSAEAQFQKALEANPPVGPAWANLGILNELYFGMLERAAECYTRYLTTQPPDRDLVAGWLREIREGTHGRGA